MGSKSLRNWGFEAGHADGSVISRIVLARTEDEATAAAKEYCERNGWDPQRTEIHNVWPLHNED